MEHEESSVKIFEKFTWKITNFATQWKKVERIYSEVFVLGGYTWRIILYPPLGDFLAIFLDAVHVKTDNMSAVWNRDVKFKLIVFNQLNHTRTITKEKYKHEFDAISSTWGYPHFIPLSELHDPEKGFVVKDVCIVGVELCVHGSLENQVDQAASLVKCPNVEVPTNDLQVLWEELKKYRSDLTWLEPHVQSALEIKNYLEKALQVEKWKEEKEAAVKLEAEKLKRKFIGKS